MLLDRPDTDVNRISAEGGDTMGTLRGEMIDKILKLHNELSPRALKHEKKSH